jgi:exopolysaccharide biosynthesis predicted pyruvyltransferase EpsI
MSQTVCPVIVSYRTRLWIQVALRSLHEHFPHWRILVVDNNPQPGDAEYGDYTAAERDWLHRQSYVDVVEQPHHPRTHGRALDRAVAWCRERGVPWLLHIEPDCLVSGTDWFARLCGGTDRGAWMSASHRKQYGPLHVTPSLWRVTESHPLSMDYAPRGPDESHPQFADLFDLPWLLKEAPARWRWFWEQQWDTGQKSWFELAVRGQTALVEDSRDFEHYWEGSLLPKGEDWFRPRPELWRYLDPHYQPPAPWPEHAVSATAQTLRTRLLQALAPLRGRRIALLGTPLHANTGDHLITLGTRAALQAAGAMLIDEQPGVGFEIERCRRADVVLFAGGGNFGDLYRHEMEARLTASEELRQPVLWLPQSVYYRDPQLLAADAGRLARCPHVELWIRDEPSLEIAARAFSNPMSLVPDMAFGLATVPVAGDPAGPLVRIQRQDPESADDNRRGIDWLLPGLTMPHDPGEAWWQVRRSLPGPSLVLTDRLHVHVVCVLADIPNVLVTGTHHKMSGFFRTWSHRHPLSRLVRTWDEAERIVN